MVDEWPLQERNGMNQTAYQLAAGATVASDTSVFGILKQKSSDTLLQITPRLTEKGPLTYWSLGIQVEGAEVWQEILLLTIKAGQDSSSVRRDSTGHKVMCWTHRA